jgi:hypothetical protein
MCHTADKQNPLVSFCQPLQTKSHALFPSLILNAGTLPITGFFVFAVVALQTDAADAVGIR